MLNHIGEIILGVMLTAFSGLLWRFIDGIEKRLEKKLDKIDETLVVMQADLKQFYGDQKKLEGRVDEISHRIK
jgi:hypothetical protein